MAVKKILVWPHPILTSVSKPVEAIDENVKALVQNLMDTLDDEGGAGLAAPQIGVPTRIFVVNIPPDHNEGNGTNGAEVFINPEIIHHEGGEFEWEEGCLSIPDQRGSLKRKEKIILKYMDLEGNIQQRSAHGYLSGCFQHELDHLNGILWINHKSKLAQDMMRRKMEKYQRFLALANED